MTTRDIITIDEAKCTGCGECVIACAEGAVEIIDGKAKIVSDSLCDGFGVCIGHCPEDALKVEKKDVAAFDEEAVKERLAELWAAGKAPAAAPLPMVQSAPPACPSAQMHTFEPSAQGDSSASVTRPAQSLSHWPIKLNLVPPGAPFLNDAHLVLAADCVSFAVGGGIGSLVPHNSVLIGCPKFDDVDFALQRLTGILSNSSVQSLTVVHMEVPCCAGYWHIAERAVEASGKQIPLKKVVVGVQGQEVTPAAFAG